MPDKIAPCLLVKADLRKPSATWQALDAASPNLPAVLARRGVQGVEVAIASSGEPNADTEALNRLRAWSQAWHDAGLDVYVHPYTSGAANPAACETAGSAAITAFRRVANAAAALSERSGRPVTLTYHAAEAGPAEFGVDPRTVRDRLLARSCTFFEAAFALADSFAGRVDLVTETQLPTAPEAERVRIGDRPDELVAILAGRSHGLCWDTGHYLIGVERIGLPTQATPDWVACVTHMHVHDVVDGRDHRLLSPASVRVARYVAQAVATGRVRSITLEYDYGQGQPAGAAIDAEQALAHVAEACALVRDWAESGRVRQA